MKQINWHYEEHGESDRPTLLLLHGFTGSSQSWLSFSKLLDSRFRIVAVDLPGHGMTPVPKQPLSLFRLADALAVLIRNLELNPVNVIGYSMGGRVALHLALAHQDLLSSMILIGASPGIRDDQERNKRRELDRLLAESIRTKGIEWFVDFWEQQPIFKSQASLSATERTTLRTQRLQNGPDGLAYALDQWSPGCQADLLSRVQELTIPLLLLAGEKDDKYRALNEEIVRNASEHTTNLVVPDAGHAVQVEQPQITVNYINVFLGKIQE